MWVRSIILFRLGLVVSNLLMFVWIFVVKVFSCLGVGILLKGWGLIVMLLGLEIVVMVGVVVLIMLIFLLLILIIVVVVMLLGWGVWWLGIIKLERLLLVVKLRLLFR